MGPNDTKTSNNSPTPALSGSAPVSNPFSSNSIPPSGTGDIILSPSQTQHSPKKGIIAIVIIAIVLIVALVAVTLIHSFSDNHGGNQVSSTLKTSFNNLASIVIDGSSSSNVDLTTNPNDWQLAKIANSINHEEQASYADQLKKANNAFSDIFNNYYVEYPDQFSSSGLPDKLSELSDKITALVLYLRMNQFGNELNNQLSSSDTYSLQSSITDEIKMGIDTSDESSVDIIASITAYYQEIIDESRQNDMLDTFRSEARDQFSTIATELSPLLINTDTIIGGLE